MRQFLVKGQTFSDLHYLFWTQGVNNFGGGTYNQTSFRNFLVKGDKAPRSYNAAGMNSDPIGNDRPHPYQNLAVNFTAMEDTAMTDMGILVQPGGFFWKSMDDYVFLDVGTFADPNGTDIAPKNSARPDVTTSLDLNIPY